MGLVFPSPRLTRASACAVAAAVALALGQEACGADEEQRVRIRVGALASCPIGAPRGMSLVGYGDFPVAVPYSWDASDPDRLAALPEDTRAVRARLPGASASAAFVGVAATEAALPAAFDVVLLPESAQPCVLQTPAGDLPAAPALAVRPDGGFVLAGGEVDDVGDARAYVWTPRSRRFESLDGLLSRRMRAAASATPDATVVVSGGAPERAAAAHATAEILLGGADAFDRVPIALGEPRCDHASVALADGSVLLLGGRASPDAAPVRTAELLDVATRRTRSDFAPMIVGRAGHDAAVLDDGSVIVAGGLGADGRGVSLVERFDPASRTFSAEGSFAPEHACSAGWSIVPLVGARALLVSRCPSTPLYVWLRVGGLAQQSASTSPFPGSFAAAAALTDARVLMVGRGADGAPHAELLDPFTWRKPLAGDRAAEHDPEATLRLAALQSGDLVELESRIGLAGAHDRSIVRLRSGGGQSIFETPPRLLVGSDSLSIALDAARAVLDVCPSGPSLPGEPCERWEGGDGIRPVVSGAEAWIVRARFARFRIEVTHVAEGEPSEASAVLLGRAPEPLVRSAAPLRIEWDDARLAIRGDTDCTIAAPRPVGTDRRLLVVERLGADAVRASATDLGADGSELARAEIGPCGGLGLPDRVSIGLAPARGHRLRDLAIERIAP